MFFLKNKSIHLIFVSFFVYFFLNLIENYLHYNIGRHRDDNFIKLSLPSNKDWIKIFFIMIIFALLQGIFTYLFNYWL